MAVKTITILQVGDVHFDQLSIGPEVDVKDPQISPDLVRQMAPSRLRSVMQAIEKRCDPAPPDAIVFCGDLSSRGEHGVYVDCVAYLNKALGLSEGRFWTPDGIHAVPGNHDIDRDTVDPAGKDYFAKFLPLEKAWQDIHLDVLACADVRPTLLHGQGGGEATAYSMNSCIGCGEKRARQGEFTAMLRADLEARKTEGDEAAADALWEGLDTPLFFEEHLTTVNDAIDKLALTQLPIVIAHHNLLPQATPRAAIYTELVNGGAARVRLAAHRRWIIYLHGHIHDDPIEVIDQRFPNQGQVLSISAPLLQEGFNVVSVEFGNAGRPMGVSVVHYRYKNGGDVRARPEIRIGLASRADEPSPLLNHILAALAPGTSMRFRDLETAVTAIQKRAVSQDDLCDALREAEWANYLAIEQRADDAGQWTIRREAV
jgi:predicted phosphodiesterase